MLREFEQKPYVDLRPWPHQLAMLAAADNGSVDLMRKLSRQSHRVKAQSTIQERWSGWSVHLAGSCLVRLALISCSFSSVCR
jgi:hypothetical protein